jgi:hypothetical protein
MNPERKEFLNLLSLPGRISATEAAWKLGFETDHIHHSYQRRTAQTIGPSAARRHEILCGGGN